MITFGYKTKFSSIMRACAAIAVGLVMVITTDATENVVRIIAAFLFAAGVVSLVYGFIKRKEGALSLWGLNAIVDIVIGLLLYCWPSSVAHLITYLIGIGLLIFGIIQILALAGTMSLVGMGAFSLLTAFVATLCGVMLLFNPFTMKVMSIIAGVALIIYGINELVSTWRVSKAKEAYEIKYAAKEEKSQPDGQTFTTDSLSDAKEVDFEKE